MSVTCYRVPGSHYQGPRCQSPMSQGHKSQGPEYQFQSARVPSFRVPRSQGPGSRGLRSQGPRSQVSGPDFRLCHLLLFYLFINVRSSLFEFLTKNWYSLYIKLSEQKTPRKIMTVKKYICISWWRPCCTFH